MSDIEDEPMGQEREVEDDHGLEEEDPEESPEQTPRKDKRRDYGDQEREEEACREAQRHDDAGIEPLPSFRVMKRQRWKDGRGDSRCIANSRRRAASP